MASGSAAFTLSSAPITKATGVVVSIGGGMGRGAMVRSVVWTAGDKPNFAEIEFAGRFEGFQGITPDETVEISLKLPGGGRVVIFCGRVTGRGGQADKSGEHVLVTCLGPRHDLTRDYVLGREVPAFLPSGGESAEDAELQCVTALQCIFNADGRSNRSEPGKNLATIGFSGDPRAIPAGAKSWTLAQALEYVYRQRLQDKRYETREAGAPPAANKVGHPLGEANAFGHAILRSRSVYGANVDGMNLLAAIHHLLEAGSLRWFVRPRGVGDGPYGELRVTPKSFVPGISTGYSLKLPRISGGTLPRTTVSPAAIAGSGAQYGHARIHEDWSRVVDEVVVMGGPVLFEAEFTLVPGWRTLDEIDVVAAEPPPALPPTLEVLNILRTKTTEGSSEAWNPDPALPAEPYHRDVGRAWILDETGYETDRDRDAFDWLTSPDGEEEAEPLEILEPVAVRPRPFRNELSARSALSDSGAGASVARRLTPAGLAVWHPDIAEWRNASVSWELDRERAGIRITDREIARAPFFNDVTLKWATKVRIRMAVETDWLAAASSGSGGGLVPGRLLVKGEREFRQDIGNTTESGAQLAAAAAAKAQANSFPIRSATFGIPWLAPGYEPGHWITGLVGRRVALEGQIIEVRFDVAAQDTHIVLEESSIHIGGRK